jgi:thermitase
VATTLRAPFKATSSDVGFTGMRALVVAAIASLVLAPKPLPLAPNDPGWSGQWGLRQIGVPQVWQRVGPDAHPVIATVDTGVDAGFADLHGAVVPGWDVIGNDADTADVAGHGTDVALVIAANTNNRYGIAGACPMCRIMPVRVSIDRTAQPATIAAGIRWAVDHGARIIVVSIVHTGAVDPAEQPAVDYAVAHGAVVIGSAGNDPGSERHYPAALHGVVAVAASDDTDQLYPWATQGAWVALAAPGCEYGSEMCGASYAPPLVAGAVGLLVAAGGVTPQRAMDALTATAVPVQGIGGGRIDVLAAARRLGIFPQPAPSQPVQRLDLQRGSFARTLRRTLVATRGPLSIVVTRTAARSCTMTLRSKDAAYVTSQTTVRTVSLRTQVTAGTYVLTVTCVDPRSRPYSMVVTGLARQRY